MSDSVDFEDSDVNVLLTDGGIEDIRQQQQHQEDDHPNQIEILQQHFQESGRTSTGRYSSILTPRKRVLAAAISNKILQPSQNSVKRLKTMDIDQSFDSTTNNDSKMNILSGSGPADGMDKRPNFSALGNGSNGTLLKIGPGNAGKPSDIKKLVIKNFKCKISLRFFPLKLL